MAPLPPEAVQFYNEGHRLLMEKAFPEAEACFRRSLALAPECVEAMVNLAWALEQEGRAPEAEPWYLRALAQDGTCLPAHLNLGVLLVNQKRFQEAEARYRLALQVHPEAPGAWSNLAALQILTQRYGEGEASCLEALRLDPGHKKARFNLGYLRLREGRFEEGWEGLEARELSPFTGRFTFPRWRGEPLEGRSLLIGIEVGHGDMIQFCRYAALLKRRGAGRLGLVCHPALKRLFLELPEVDQVIGLEEGIPATGWDLWTLPLSLPHLCGTRLDTIPADLPYLRPRPEWVETWRPRLPEDGLKVGLVWKGNAKFEGDRERTLPHLSLLEPLGAVPGVRFVSLQKGRGEDEAAHPPPGLPLVDLGPAIRDFADLAGIMASLDLVISVDTGAAHLAGALGRPCWVLIPDYRTDWRWLTERTDSPWYPGAMRLFRQPKSQRWEPVIDEVAACLKALAG